MYVLGIETATSVASIALISGDVILSERMINSRCTHSVNLINMIDDTLKSAGVELAQLGGVAVSVGPGSFTGLRIGITVAKILAFALQIPVAPVSTLKAMAYKLYGCEAVICPMLNARKGEIYTAMYKMFDGRLVNVSSPAAMPIEQLIDILNGEMHKTIFLGDAVKTHYEKLASGVKIETIFAFDSLNEPSAANVALLGSETLQRGEGINSFTLKPEYICLSQAEVKWNEKHQTNRG